MPGIQWVYCPNGAQPQYGEGVLANTLAGATPPYVPIRAGDLVVQSTFATLTANAVPVIRELVAGDITANYLVAAAGSAMCGIRGVAVYDVSTNNLGQIAGAVPIGGVSTGTGVFYNFPSMAGETPVEPVTSRARIQYITASELNVFKGKLSSTSAAATPALNGTQAGISMTTNAAGVSTYFVDTTATGTGLCLRILRCDEQDPLYNAVGGSVFFQFLPTVDQEAVGVNYTAR